MGQNTKGGEQNYDLTKTKGQTIYSHTAVSVTTRNTGVYERWEMEQTQDRKKPHQDTRTPSVKSGSKPKINI